MNELLRYKEIFCYNKGMNKYMDSFTTKLLILTKMSITKGVAYVYLTVFTIC